MTDFSKTGKGQVNIPAKPAQNLPVGTKIMDPAGKSKPQPKAPK